MAKMKSEDAKYRDPRDGREFGYRPKHNLKTELERSGITQEAFAAMMGVSRNTLSEWLSGKEYMANRYIIHAAALLGVEPAYLLDLQPMARVTDDEQRTGGRYYKEQRAAIKKVRKQLMDGATEFCGWSVTEDEGEYGELVEHEYYQELELVVDRKTNVIQLEEAAGPPSDPRDPDEIRAALLKELNELRGDYRDMVELSRCASEYLTETFAAYAPQLFSRLSPILRDFAHDYPICVHSRSVKGSCAEASE